MSDFRKCFKAHGMGYVGGARRFASPDQPNEKSFLLSVFGHRYLELNLLDFQLICEANLSTIIFPQRCFRTLIKCCVIYKSFWKFYRLPYYILVQAEIFIFKRLDRRE